MTTLAQAVAEYRAFEIEEYLRQMQVALTVDEIARGIRSRTAYVRTLLRSDPRFTVVASNGRTERRKLYTLAGAHPEPSGPRDGRGRAPTQNERVLRLLKDGKPHTHTELYRLGCVAHSRIADLRRRGHRIECWREGKAYLYQLGPA